MFLEITLSRPPKPFEGNRGNAKQKGTFSISKGILKVKKANLNNMITFEKYRKYRNSGAIENKIANFRNKTSFQMTFCV